MTKYLVWLTMLVSSVAHGSTLTIIRGGNAANKTIVTKVIAVDDYVTELTSADFFAQYLSVKSKPGPLYVYIQSGGGLESAGWQMIQLVDAEKLLGNKVICMVDRKAYSMAFNLLTHCSERYATYNSKLLAHPIATTLDCSEDATDEETGHRCTPDYLTKMAFELELIEMKYSIPNAEALHLSTEDYSLLSNAEHMWRVPELLDNHYLNGMVWLQFKKSN